jgi:SAM-dependent methyltransferase
MPKDPSSVDAAYWDALARRMGAHHLEENIAIYKRSEHIRLIRAWGGVLKGKTVLKTDLYEEAFGADHFLFWLLNRGAVVVGMDISVNVAGAAKRRSALLRRNLHLASTSDICRTAFKDASFDMIICNSTLDNMPFADVPRALSELYRILKPGGTLILTLDNAHNPLYRLGYFLAKIFRTQGHYQDRCYSLRDVEALVSREKFHWQDVRAIVHIPTPFNKAAVLLTRLLGKRARRFLRRAVMFFSGAGKSKRMQFLTGWFLAFKMVKI